MGTSVACLFLIISIKNRRATLVPRIIVILGIPRITYLYRLVLAMFIIFNNRFELKLLQVVTIEVLT